MSTEEIAEFIDAFNEGNSHFDIGLNFMVAGIGHIQQVIKQVEDGSYDPKVAQPLLEQADQMIAFSMDRIGSVSELASFAERYRKLAADLRTMMT